MPASVQVGAGKLIPCGSGVSEVARPTLSNEDRVYLVDTGASISVLPRRPNDIEQPLTLYDANRTPIKTYGTRRLQVNLNRSFPWDFTIADVDQPIIGTDFLAHYDLLVDEQPAHRQPNTTPDSSNDPARWSRRDHHRRSPCDLPTTKTHWRTPSRREGALQGSSRTRDRFAVDEQLGFPNSLSEEVQRRLENCG